MADYGKNGGSGFMEEVADTIQAQITRLKAELKDLDTKLTHSKGQVDTLRQRNATIMAEVQRIDAALEQVPRLNIKQTYDEALTSQQRLITLQGQVEKLEEQETALRNQLEFLSNLITTVRSGDKQAEDSVNPAELLIRIIDAQETERDHLARLMHDGPAHSLTNFILQAEIAQKMFDKNPSRAREELVKLKEKAGEAFQKVRTFIFDLRPMMLSDLGLAPTLKRYAQDFAEKAEIGVNYEGPSTMRRLENYREVMLFRGIQSVMSNARENGATSLTVSLKEEGNQIIASVEDNGRGFGTGQLSMDSNNPEAIGLGALQERVMLVGGALNVSNVPGGTRVEIEIPSGPAVQESNDADD